MSEPENRVERSVGAIIFDTLVIAFSGLLVITSLGLRPGVGTVPLLVGVPTLVGALVLLVGDLFPRVAEAVEPEGDEPDGVRRFLSVGFAEIEGDDEIPDDPASRRRQIAFTLWLLAFVALATLTSFYLAVPVALVAILLAVRLHWLAVIVVTLATVGGFYGLFDLFLGVRL